jgi:uncharacterized GH25 family protein
MKRYLLPFLLLLWVLLGSHDMYLKLDNYFLPPHTTATIQLFNGTFDKSDNVIDRDRMIDVSLVGNGQRSHPATAQWSELDSVTLLTFKTGEPGTWVAGVSTRPRSLAMTAADFNDYLAHDGVLDMLAARKANNTLDQDAVERYSKHVKTIFQVGDSRTDDWQTRLGYPIEFVPLGNPYHLHTDEALRVQLLWQGEPLPNQLVYVDHVATHSHADATAGHTHAHAGETPHTHPHESATASSHEHEHEHTDDAAHEHEHESATATDHQHTAGTQLRTDADGIVTVTPTEDGTWYLRTIYLAESDEPGLTHESNWATLTFAVANRHSHGPEETAHTHADAAEGGIPAYVYWIGSLALIGGLFLWFNRKPAA